MINKRLRGLLGPVLALSCVTALVGCGRDADGAAGADPAADGSAGAAPLTSQSAAAVLAAFDRADSAASSAGDLTALAEQEVDPALRASVAAVHRTRARNATQPAFQHVDPVFAVPTGTADCFLVAATLKSSGAELAPTDFSQFISTSGGWRLSHNVQVGQGGVAAVRGVGRRPAVTTAQAIGEDRRAALVAEVFARTTGTRSNGPALVNPGALLDQQFAAGWQIYQQQMAQAGMTVNRSLTGNEWSACAAPTDGGTLAFLTLRATDTIASAPGGPAKVTLPVQSPDMAGTGQRAPLTGGRITVTRVEVFLLLVPPPGGGGATVLGLSDAPVAISAVG